MFRCPRLVARLTLRVTLAFLFILTSLARADEVVLADGTRIESCLARDEGLEVLVWESPATFPDHPTRLARDEVKEIRIQRDATFDRHAPLPDLAVTHIELTPRLAGLHGLYRYDETGAVRLVPRTDLASIPGQIDPERARAAIHDLGDAGPDAPQAALGEIKLHHEAGEAITLTGQIVNTGFAPVEGFDYAWLIDGEEVASGSIAKRLDVLERSTVTLPWRWQKGRHEATLRVISDQPEIADFNNERTDPLWGFGFFFVFSNRRVAYAHDHRNTLGSFSIEDYYQWHLDLMNRLFAASRYPSQPQGIQARVRLDRIIYLDTVTDAEVDRRLVGRDGVAAHQGGWIWRDSEAERRGDWPRPFGNFFGAVTEWSLPHELGHQLGLIDLYNLDYPGREAFIAESGRPVHTAHFFRNPQVMMHWHGPHLFSEISAAYLNRTWEMPRGIFGEYLFETPDETWLLILDVNGRPLPEARVRLYQRSVRIDHDAAAVEGEGVSYRPVIEDGQFPPAFVEMQPVIEGVTDASGRLHLPNRPVREVHTLNGYRRRPNPFGNINVVGGRGLMLIDVSRAGRHETFWLEITDLNLACIRGHKSATTQVLRTGLASPDSPPPPVYPRLQTDDGRHLSLAWNDPVEPPRGRRVNRYQIYRRVASEGLNFDPWESVAVVGAGVHQHEMGTLDDLQPRPALWTEPRRIAFGIASLDAHGTQSEIVELGAPRLERTHSLLRRGGAYFLEIEAPAPLWRVVRPGCYEDWTPQASGVKPGDRYDTNRAGQMVSCAWDRHAVHLYEPGSFASRRRLGHPFEAGEQAGRMRNVRDASIDECGWVAAADSENRRVVLFDAEGRQRLVITGPDTDQAFTSRILQVRLRSDTLMVRDESGTLFVFSLCGRPPKTAAGEETGEQDAAPANRHPPQPLQATLLGRVTAVGPSNFDLLGTDQVVILQHEPGGLRLHDLHGGLICETRELHGQPLQHPRGLVIEEDGSLTVFNGYSELLNGRIEDALTTESNESLELTGPFAHPRRYPKPVLQPKVLVLDFDPRISLPGGAGERRLHEVAGWNAPQALARDYSEDLRKASGGYLAYRIVAWEKIDGYPRKTDGFTYDDASYQQGRESGQWHDPDGMDYRWLIDSYELSTQVREGVIDEVWVFGAPYFGYYESRMVGPGAYWCNSPGIDDPRAGRLYVIMGFNYERGVAEMIHDLGHRLESTMSHVYEPLVGPWRAEELRSDWERFSALEIYHPGRSGVGNCHFPCNGEDHYDYANPREVLSCADAWRRYPEVRGSALLQHRKPTSAATWGAADAHRAYMQWLFSHLPRAPGRNPEGILCNWWEYLINMSAHAESRGRSE